MDERKTIIEWAYTPEGYLEAPHHIVAPEYAVEIVRGRATAVLTSPTEPVPDELYTLIEEQLREVFDARLLLAHQIYTINAPRTDQHYPDGRKGVAVRLRGVGSLVAAVGTVDILVTDGRGNVLRDSKAERIAADSAFIARVVTAIRKHPLMRQLIASFRGSLADPENALVHLYEVRDALAQHYGSEATARHELHIAKTEWSKLGSLANVEPLSQGRHRGRHPARRPATRGELEEATSIARKLIEAFATQVVNGADVSDA